MTYSLSAGKNSHSIDYYTEQTVSIRAELDSSLPLLTRSFYLLLFFRV